MGINILSDKVVDFSLTLYSGAVTVNYFNEEGKSESKEYMATGKFKEAHHVTIPLNKYEVRKVSISAQ
jgi:uncharacterized protein YxeA